MRVAPVPRLRILRHESDGLCVSAGMAMTIRQCDITMVCQSACHFHGLWLCTCRLEHFSPRISFRRQSELGVIILLSSFMAAGFVLMNSALVTSYLEPFYRETASNTYNGALFPLAHLLVELPWITVFGLIVRSTHAPTHPRTHAPTHPRTHAPTHPLTHAPTHSVRAAQS